MREYVVFFVRFFSVLHPIVGALGRFLAMGAGFLILPDELAVKFIFVALLVSDHNPCHKSRTALQFMVL